MIPVISPNYFMQKASYMQAKLIADTISVILDIFCQGKGAPQKKKAIFPTRLRAEGLFAAGNGGK